MGYKTILVHMDAAPRSAERVEVAFALADRYDAHLVGLFAVSAVHIPSYIRTDASELLIAAQASQRAEAAARAAEQFRAAAARYGGAKAEWRVSQEDALDAVLLNARYSDLVVVGQHERDTERDTAVATGFVDELVLSCGRPALAVPYAGHFRGAFKRALVAWNASPEAARAMSGALPLLSRAERVDVVVFDAGTPGDHGEEPGADAALYLARHGVKAAVSRYGSPGIAIGEQILTRAADLSADLIVMGAYGHSRMRELVLGGATRTLLESMTVPVLMSH